MARRLQHRSAQVQRLEQQVRAPNLNLDRLAAKIRPLEDQLSLAFFEKEKIDPITTPADSIFHDLLPNHGRLATSRPYSWDTLISARRV
jgi:hypothetical protein